MTPNPDISAAARLVAGERRRTEVICAECGTTFEATARRRYCSNTCNVRAWRRRKRATTTPEVPAKPVPLSSPGRVRALDGLATQVEELAFIARGFTFDLDTTRDMISSSRMMLAKVRAKHLSRLPSS